jgi:bis(5'-nucleosyl)-tetraphosphatase (symmetrical)
MATYAIGDIQGCFLSLQALLELIRFDTRKDRLWFVGDLVNRGPASLEVLRWARAHDEHIVCVLGNHDLHLLAAAAGLRKAKPLDTLTEVLEADDRDELLDWLRHRPLAHREKVGGRRLLMVHAGLHPRWTVKRTLRLAKEAGAALTRHGGKKLLTALIHSTPTRWHDKLTGAARLSMIVALLTRLRTCHSNGTPCTDFAGPPEDAPSGSHAWHALPRVAWDDHVVLCGHWAAQGLALTERVVALDSACVWGGSLSACRLEDGEVFSVSLQDEVALGS